MTKKNDEPKLVFEPESGESPEWGYSYVDGTPVTEPHWDARVTSVEVLTGTIVYLKFRDGFEGPLDLRPIMRGPVFDRVRELGEFNAVGLEAEDHPITIAWPSGADIAPETLRYEAGSYKVPYAVLSGFEMALDAAVEHAKQFGRRIAASEGQRDGASKLAQHLFITYARLSGIKLESPEGEAAANEYYKRWR